MKILEINLEKPALKRTEVAARTEDAEDSENDAGSRGGDTDESSEVTDSATTDDTPAEESDGGGRLGRTTAVVGTLVAGVVGLLTLKKLRSRREE